MASDNNNAAMALQALNTPTFLQGGGEMGALMRSHDWRATKLGEPNGWPGPLRTALRVILNTGHPMYIWWGPELLCFYNDAYRRSIGPERHPGSLGRPGREVWEEIWGIIGPQIERVTSGGGAVWYENALVPITRNGRREDVYWTYSYSPIDDPAGKSGVGGVLVVCAETTEQVLAARTAVAEKEWFTQLFQQTPTFMAILRGSENRIVLLNPAYQQLIGHRDVLNRTVAEALPDAAAQGYVALLERVYSSGEPYVASGAKYAVQLAPDGPIDERYVDFVYQPIKNASGVVTGILLQGVDVTDRIRGSAALLQSEEQLRLATEAGEVGLWDVDVGSDALYWPPRVRAMFGITSDSPVSISGDFFPCIHPEDRERVTQAYAAALDPQRRALYEVEYRTVGKEDGVIRWVAAKGRGLFDGERCVRILGTAVDITDRKATEAELKDLNERLEHRVAAALAEKSAAEAHIRQAQKIEALGQLTGGVAHDFNNLLMIIKGGVSLLRRPLIEPERRQRLLAGMEQAADRGATLSRQLLTFARRQPLKPESVDLSQQIEGMRELLDRTLRGDVKVKTDFSDDLWPVEVDPAELEFVILNLCVNARDAMPNGGEITIRARNAADVRQGRVSGHFVSLNVTDTGTGMPPEVLEHVFEPFYTTKEIGKGSGLGLPQVHGFAEQSGGTVKIDSAVGRGTTVTLLLPRSEMAPVAEATSIDLDDTTRRRAFRGSVLLVEDDDEVAALVTEMLQELGYRVTRAASARAALGALANDRAIDVVFSDVLMPGNMNGFELAKEVKLRRPDLPVILTTGYASAALTDGAADIHVLQKPYEMQSLDNAIRAALASE
ncbi:MAG: ATP-binding protein [Gammaproteobacteria bacterium]